MGIVPRRNIKIKKPAMLPKMIPMTLPQDNDKKSLKGSMLFSIGFPKRGGRDGTATRERELEARHAVSGSWRPGVLDTKQ